MKKMKNVLFGLGSIAAVAAPVAAVVACGEKTATRFTTELSADKVTVTVKAVDTIKDLTLAEIAQGIAKKADDKTTTIKLVAGTTETTITVAAKEAKDETKVIQAIKTNLKTTDAFYGYLAPVTFIAKVKTTVDTTFAN